ncbi:MAG TPA: T9SS type A sorting domain-containing protein [Puia sp.]|jgi:hypothetical protein|nr:T9SS type A sorting domain-containing protein [Puia sp.]
MKKAVLLSTIIFSSLCLHAQWRTIYSGADSIDGNVSASFFSASAGYFVNRHWLGYTTDSGHTFQQSYITNVNLGGNSVNLTFGFLPTDIQAFNSSNIAIGGNYGYEPSILYSSDGGNTWTLVYHRNLTQTTGTASNSIYMLAFPGNGSTGYAVQNNEIIKTTNGGQSWATVSYTNGGTFTLSAPDANTVFAASPTTIYSTTNGGANWTSISVPFTIQAMTAYSATHVYAITPVGDTYSSTDGGNTWLKANSQTGQIQANAINYIHFISDSVGYACGSGIIQTRNSGVSWEAMPISFPSNRLYDFSKLDFYTTQQIWAPNFGEILDLTTNGGGIPYPRALFDINTAQVCASNTVQLVNQGQPGETYAWYKNRVLFATTYNASYTAPTGNDTIKLVVHNGGMADSMTRVVTTAALSSFALNAWIQDTACSNQTLRVYIYNSDPSIAYQVKRPCCSSIYPINGTGGTLNLPYYLSPTEDSVSTFTVYAYRSTPCGNDTASESFKVRLMIANPVTTTLTDTICGQDTFNIRVPATRLGYKYFAGTMPAVIGTGGAIQIPCVAGQAQTSTNIVPSSLLRSLTFPIYAEGTYAGACGADQVATATMIARYTTANFGITGYTWFTGDVLKLTNATQYANSYLWTPGSGGVPDSSTDSLPAIHYNTGGYHTLGMKATTKEGCIDSMSQVVEVYGNDGPLPATAVCPSGLAGNRVDSLNGGRYLVDRAIFEDAQGNRVLAGGWTNGAAPAGNEGWWAAKFNKSGQQQWFLYQNEVDFYSTYWYYPHIVIEQAVGDSAGNTYLMGHQMNQQYITAVGEPQTTTLAFCDFLMKISAAGHIVWVKPLYSMDGSQEYQFESGGSLLLGKGGTSLYVVSQRYPGSAYAIGSTTVLAAGVGHEGVIMQLDLDGNVLRVNSFLCPPVTLYNPIMSSTANYWHAPPATFVNGNLVVYTTLYASQGTVENATVPFSSTTIPQALVVWDTASLHALKVLPVYSTVTGSTAGVTPVAYAMDSTGAYYADYNAQVITQVKTYIEGFNPSGTVVWTKIADGLEPERMYVSGGQLKVCGTNYPGAGYTDGGGTMIGAQPSFDSSNKRLSVVGSVGAFDGQGGHGLGSLDIVLATMQTSDGSLLDFQALGSPFEDERMVMVKGAGNQLWVAGSVGSKFLECCGAPNYALYTYKLPITNDCYGGYPNQAPFLKWGLATDTATCTDSLYTVSWSSAGVGTVSIRYKVNGASGYTPLVSGLQAVSDHYTFNAVAAGVLGNVQFVIFDDDSSTLADTTARQLTRSAAVTVTIAASDTVGCAGAPVRFTAVAVNGGATPAYQWLDGTTKVGGNADTLTLNSLKNNDMIRLQLTGSAACSSPAVATSNTVTMTVTTGVAPAVVISGGTTGLKGKVDTMAAHAVNAGVTPVYSWQDSTTAHSWATVTGATDSVLLYTPADSGDRLRCIVHGSTACSPVDSALSNILAFTVNTPVAPPPDSTGGTTSDTTGTGGVYLFPNPAHSSITIDTLSLSDEWQTLDVLDMSGNEWVAGMSIVNQTVVVVPVGNLSKGIYMVRMTGKKKKMYLKFLKL